MCERLAEVRQLQVANAFTYDETNTVLDLWRRDCYPRSVRRRLGHEAS